MNRGVRAGLLLALLAMATGLVYVASWSGSEDTGGSASTITTQAVVPPALPQATPATVAEQPPTTSEATPSSMDDPATTYLIWVSGGLSPDFVAGLEELSGQVSVVKGDSVELAAGDDGAIPLDGLALDPVAHQPFDPHHALAPLQAGTIVLGETSASLRRVETDDQLLLAGHEYRVAAIVPDEVVAAAEVVFHVDDPNLPVATDRFALVKTVMSRSRLAGAVAGLHGDRFGLRVRAEGDVPWLRHADGILPQVFLKVELGEFSYTGLEGGEFQQSAGFMDASIVATDIPLLGEVKCHRTVTELLVGVMDDLVKAGLADLVDPAGFAGCWYPRFTRTATGSPAGVSRHAWGAAVDINAPANPFGAEGSQDSRLVETFKTWGFNWGGDWALPDPMHFEYAGR
ncbi:MAG TPA: M15 family metallopeptidase [Acidimicrobiia bacterium]|nr:M15 family metallopeptidase [Acidimicrobiia bacterium]